MFVISFRTQTLSHRLLDICAPIRHNASNSFRLHFLVY